MDDAAGRRTVRSPVLEGLAPAKVNLVLEVVGRRDDGFHTLRSVMAPLELADRLSVRADRLSVRADRLSVRADRLTVQSGDLDVRPDELDVRRLPAREAAPPGPDRLEVHADANALEAMGPASENLVLRAAAALRSSRPGRAGRLPPLVFELEKRVPVAAGLGGGSSDAATALRLAAAAWAIPLKEERRRRLAAGLGSDVPFFVIGGWALVGGRGERLTRLPPPRGGDAGILLVTPDVRLATPDVFAAYDRLAAPQVAHGGSSRPAGPASPGRLLAAGLRSGVDAVALARLDPANDLWPAAASLVPGLAALRDGLAALAGRPVHLSGSGPTLFAVYPSGEGAELDARRVEAAVRSGALPVPGRGRPTIIATRTLGADTPGGQE